MGIKRGVDRAAQSGVVLCVRLWAQGTLHAPALSVQTAAVTKAELGTEQQRLAQQVSTDSLPTQGHVLIGTLIRGVDAGPLGVIQDQGVGATAVERTLRVHTDSSRAALLLTLIMICTLEQDAVEDISTGAVAAEAWDVVDAYTALTNLRTEALALIHVFVVESSRSCGDVASTVRTQSLELRCLWVRTGVVYTASAPALAFSAAALLKSRVGRENAADATLRQCIVTLPELLTASRGQRGVVRGQGEVYRREGARRRVN